MAESHGVDLVKDGRAKTIAQIIDNVSWSTEKKRRGNGTWTDWHDNCIELHCVQDADRLDAIGAFGSSISNQNLCILTVPTLFPLTQESCGVLLIAQ